MNKSVEVVQLELPLLIDSAEVMRLLSIGKTRFNQIRQSGEFGPQPVPISTSGKLLFSRKSLEAWVESGCPRRREWLQRKGVKNAKTNTNQRHSY